MKKLLAVVLLSITIATPALAESPVYGGFLAGDQYLGVVGGYQIDKMYAVELSYAKIFTPDVLAPLGVTTKTDAYNAGANLVVMLPWKIKNVPELTFFAKGGLEHKSTKVSVTGLPSVTTTETKLALGGGAQYDVTKNFSARAGVGLMGTHNDLYVAAIFRF